MPDDEKFPIRELCAARVSEWEINKSRDQHSTQTSVDSVGLTRLQPLVIVVLDQAREPDMFFGSPFLHYRLIRGTITAIALMGSVTFRATEYIVLLVLSTVNNTKVLHKKDNYMLQSGMFFPTVLRGESAMRPKSPGRPCPSKVLRPRAGCGRRRSWI